MLQCCRSWVRLQRPKRWSHHKSLYRRASVLNTRCSRHTRNLTSVSSQRCRHFSTHSSEINATNQTSKVSIDVHVVEYLHLLVLCFYIFCYCTARWHEHFHIFRFVTVKSTILNKISGNQHYKSICVRLRSIFMDVLQNAWCVERATKKWNPLSKLN